MAITANTPHLVFDALVARAHVPLLSIVETCADEASRRGLQRVLLLGTGSRWRRRSTRRCSDARGIDVVVPDEEERQWIHAIYVGELLRGEFHDSTRRELVAIVERTSPARTRSTGSSSAGPSCRCCCGAGRSPTLPVLDTTALHVDAIVQAAARREEAATS